MRRSSIFFIYIAITFIILCLFFIQSSIEIRMREGEIRMKKETVRVLGITDLCLFTEARYTRHPSMADQHTPFQDYPLSLEHFPSGSMVNPYVRDRGNLLATPAMTEGRNKGNE